MVSNCSPISFCHVQSTGIVQLKCLIKPFDIASIELNMPRVLYCVAPCKWHEYVLPVVVASEEFEGVPRYVAVRRCVGDEGDSRRNVADQIKRIEHAISQIAHNIRDVCTRLQIGP